MFVQRQLSDHIIYICNLYRDGEYNWSVSGYGSIYPSTTGCKIFVIIYTVIGIPYFLATIAAIGRFFEISFMRIWDAAKKRAQDCCQRMRKIMKFTVRPPPLVERKLSFQEHFERRRLSPFIFSCFVTLVFLLMQAMAFQIMAKKRNSDEYQFDFFNSFYFVVQSVALVGFGDLYPDNDYVLVWQFPFMFLGICFLSMCFFILQESVIEGTARTSEKISSEVSKLQRKFSREFQPIKQRIRRSFSQTPQSRLRNRGSQARRVLRSSKSTRLQRSRTRSRSYDAVLDSFILEKTEEEEKLETMSEDNLNRKAADLMEYMV